MDKLQKFEYVQSIESYLEDNQVYELLESLLKQLVINRPEKPLDFLIEKLQKSESKIYFLCLIDLTAKRIFLMGPPGTNRKETALALADHFSWQCISVGDMLRNEVSKKSEAGKVIAECFKNYRYGKWLLLFYSKFSA